MYENASMFASLRPITQDCYGFPAPDPPTGLSAVHTTSTTIRVYWTPPTAMPTGYEIIYFAGAEDATGTAVSVSGGSTDNSEITDLSATVTYRVSIESVDGATRSITTGPVLAARGEQWYIPLVRGIPHEACEG